MNYNIEVAIQNFRLASRDLFNNRYIKLLQNGMYFDESFSELQALLFKSLVNDPLELSGFRYGDIQFDIFVKSTMGSSVPVMINREVDSGYWDYPIKELSSDAVVNFVSFFDFDQTRCMDGQYVVVHIANWNKQQDVAGKLALVEYQYAVFTLSNKD